MFRGGRHQGILIVTEELNIMNSLRGITWLLVQNLLQRGENNPPGRPFSSEAFLASGTILRSNSHVRRLYKGCRPG